AFPTSAPIPPPEMIENRRRLMLAQLVSKVEKHDYSGDSGADGCGFCHPDETDSPANRLISATPI
ncbi:MAG: hypothetical protein WCC90_15125, partial [Methylocella sp.]